MAHLTNRQKVLLCVIDELYRQGKSSGFMIEKNLFLLKEEEKVDSLVKFYSFFPYHYGPFSNMSFTDMVTLRTKNLINDNKKNPGLTPDGKMILRNVDSIIKQKALKTANRFDSGEQIKLHVYNNYPWYTIKSKTPKINIESKPPAIFTIGYEGRDIDVFLNTLLREGVEILVDIRYNPFSMNFSFTKSKLKKYLENVDIGYIHIPELGIRGESRKNLATKKDYEELFEIYKRTTLTKREADIKKIIELGKKKRIALMCFEHSKEMCHRGVISNYLETDSIEVMHI